MKRNRHWLILVVFFAFVNGLFIFCESWFTKKGVDTDVVILGNLIVFVATLLSFIIYLSSLKNTTGTGALKGMIGSFAVKFVICLLAVVIYVISFKENINKPALVICMGLYAIYTVIEVSSLQKILKRRKHG